ncbi:MAG: acyl carrier protein [Reyranella sp.]|uniref:acyl carrier protein n=1 Tax=Reyranella sp. TaxID=1929291 RepID=UPI003D150B72
MMTDDTTSVPPASQWPTLDDPRLLDRIIDVIAREGRVERDRIAPQATLESLDLASMDVVTILMALEDELGVYLPMDAKLSSARNLGELIAAIAEAAHPAPRQA